MGDQESRTKRASRELWLYRQCNDNRCSQSAGERHILELISLGAPLKEILNKLCASMDRQIGNVVSVVLLPDQDENPLYSISQCAVQAGLNVFSSTPILSRDRTFLGTLQIFRCDQRHTTQREIQLIERVVCLAAVALRRQMDVERFERSSRLLRSGIGGNTSGRAFFIN